ncbi:hypothetical protein BJ322DRAFT_1112988 [Thelephora terrestris]|uniref:Tubby C-terminal-like domain-containing protein n=1 Tax=Thelephora terrestris TaxID=56493 RepID=A0A9P6L3B9_9AGAM|nr:hypothetical protein BJ322DRAFT_1112988 [Thelephora terrestris]
MPPVYVLNLPSPVGATKKIMDGYAPGSPLGVFSDYSSHGAEISIKIREGEQNRLEIFTSDERLYLTVVGRRDSKILFDNQGVAVLNVRNKALNFGGEYQVFEGDGDTLSLFTVRNKWSLGGPRMVANLTNFDDESVELQVRGKLLNSSGKITLHGQPVAKFEGGILEPIADQPKKLETLSRMTVAPLVDVAMVVTIFVCLQDIASKD